MHSFWGIVSLARHEARVFNPLELMFNLSFNSHQASFSYQLLKIMQQYLQSASPLEKSIECRNFLWRHTLQILPSSFFPLPSSFFPLFTLSEAEGPSSFFLPLSIKHPPDLGASLPKSCKCRSDSRVYKAAITGWPTPKLARHLKLGTRLK